MEKNSKKRKLKIEIKIKSQKTNFLQNFFSSFRKTKESTVLNIDKKNDC